MRRIAYLTDVGFVLCCLLIAGSTSAGEAPPFEQAVKPVPAVVHGYCYADALKKWVYFSAAFSSPPVGGPGGTTQQETLRILGSTSEAWRRAFEAYLTKKYGNAGFVQCAMEDSLPQAQARRQELLDKFRRDNDSYYASKRTFVETDWVYAVPTRSP
jgi:hypothetical protein